MKTKLLALALLAGGSMFAETRFSVGINLGGYNRGYYPQTSPYAAVQPPCPGPDYTWTDGYWSQNGGRNLWVNGSWNRQPYNGYRAQPYYQQPSYDNRSYDAYGRQGYNRGYDQNQNRGFERDSHQNRGFDRDGDRDDEHDRGRGYSQDNRYGNGFRGR